jgi:hypothetical protein
MRIPKLSDCCEIEILGMPPSNRYGGPGVALKITAHLNGEVYAAHHELRPELLDDDGYGESIIRHVENDIGRMVVRGRVPVDPRRRVVMMQDCPPPFDRRGARAGG